MSRLKFGVMCLASVLACTGPLWLAGQCHSWWHLCWYPFTLAACEVAWTFDDRRDDGCSF